MNNFHGEFSSADASGLSEPNSRFTLYGARSAAALTLNAGDVVTITSLSVSSAGTNLTISVYEGADATVDAGEVVFKGVIPTNSTQSKVFAGHECQKGSYPKVKASGSGQVDVVIHGLIERQGA